MFIRNVVSIHFLIVATFQNGPIHLPWCFRFLCRPLRRGILFRYQPSYSQLLAENDMCGLVLLKAKRNINLYCSNFINTSVTNLNLYTWVIWCCLSIYQSCYSKLLYFSHTASMILFKLSQNKMQSHKV